MLKKTEFIPKHGDRHTAFLNATYFERNRSYRSFTSMYFVSIRRLICAFLNTDGGTIYCGIDIRKGTIPGIAHPEKFRKEIQRRINEFFEESIHPFIGRPTKKRIKKNKQIVIINVNKLSENHAPIHINGVYHFRIDRRTITAKENQLDYAQKIVNYGCPEYREYRSIQLEKINWRINQNNKTTFRQIGDLPNTFLYKYMDLESALLSLDNNNIRFVEPNQWDDQYEGRFYTANYFMDEKLQKEVSSELTPFLYACCFTTKQENEAAWTLYSHNKTGLAARCVEFKLNRRHLIDQIVKFIYNNSSGNGYSSLFFGKVQYEKKSIIENVHNRSVDEADNVYFHKYFDSFSLECYLNLLLIKRSSFEHEQEVRVFIIPPDQNTREKSKRMKNGKLVETKKSDPMYVDLKWEDLIEEVRIDKHCSDYEKSLLQKKLDQLFISRIRQLTKDKMDIDENKEKARFTLVDFDPYEDKSLKKGAISIVTN